ncbi:uncharacterized protein LOC106711252 isoform X2 [Papilio machaon]|uniref:uncharacterized protein LOC106711252 isoform X2 n=1 Tax=Papilio machaon TaxID=76193 RepID=UPI001E663FDB|nr:uncharacterized protein LOC106711252 isoform X2 [Papilio machaon]
MDESEEFNTLTFEKKLSQLKDTQESIQSLSSWCLKQRDHHKKIVSSWLNVLKRVKVEQRLVLFYLANDVIQYSKRKNYKFVESWGLNLQKATPLVRDEKVRPKILRIFKIWEQRSVYDDEFLSDLTGLLSAGPGKKADDDPLDFQPQQLVNKIKQCTVLEADTDLRLKYIHENHLQLSDSDALRASLKDRSNKDDVEKELNEGIACVERYTQALQREIVAREALLALLTSADHYYSTQRGEVKVVAYAYKTFGARVRALKRKLDELIPTLPSAVPSPPQRDEDVPSPGPDEDLDLPNNTGSGDDDISYNIDRTFNTSLAADGSLYNLGLSSFLTTENPLALFNKTDEINNSNKIEVINNRSSEKQDFNISDFLKTLAPNETNINTTDNNTAVNTTISQKSQEALPGLDLLTPESTGNPPPTSFYGTNVEIVHDDTEPSFQREPANAAWNTNTWRTSPLMLRGMFADTPESPPPAPLPPPPIPNMPTMPSMPTIPGMPTLAMPTPPTPPTMPTIPTIPVMTVRTDTYSQDATPTDVDHRALPPPPPPPVLPLLTHIEDIDHRLLTAPPAPPAPHAPPAPPVTTAARHVASHQDVDHRNLISLTHQLATTNTHPVKDQDYRVPPITAPSDIVESVDMDLSEDEDLQGLYPAQANAEHVRRQSFNNNKVLVGGDNGKVNINEQNNHNLIPIHHRRDREEHNFNMPPPKPFNTNREQEEFDEMFEDDIRHRGIEMSMERRNPSPPEFQNDWPQPRPPINQRFPRNWTPRNNFRPFTPQFWPRNGPRPMNRWPGPGPRPQRFW